MTELKKIVAHNIATLRTRAHLTQFELGEKLNYSDKAVSKWERGESYPDITFLPALANIFETSIDLLIGMDSIRAEDTTYNIHAKASAYQRAGDYVLAEKV